MGKLSKQAQTVLNNRIGYRSDDQSELAESFHQPSPVQIIDYEFNTLGNTDIFDTIQHLYGVRLMTPQATDRFIKDKLNSDHYYLTWLCASQMEAAEYADDAGSVYSVSLPEHMLIVSDLANEGVLVATAIDPLNVN